MLIGIDSFTHMGYLSIEKLITTKMFTVCYRKRYLVSLIKYLEASIHLGLLEDCFFKGDALQKIYFRLCAF